MCSLGTVLKGNDLLLKFDTYNNKMINTLIKSLVAFYDFMYMIQYTVPYSYLNCY